MIACNTMSHRGSSPKASPTWWHLEQALRETSGELLPGWAMEDDGEEALLEGNQWEATIGGLI